MFNVLTDLTCLIPEGVDVTLVACKLPFDAVNEVKPKLVDECLVVCG